MDVFRQFSTRRRRKLLPAFDRLDDRCLLAGFSPADVTSAYGLNAIALTSDGSTVKGDGAGETIALIEAYHDPTIVSDLQTFDQAYDLPNPTLTVDNLAGNLINSGWGLEESLDVEWAHSIAPGADILIVEAGSSTVSGLVAAVNVARNSPGVVAISMSWGFNEFRQESDYNNIFTTPSSHVGITFIASSGDSGASGGPEWPSIAPTVLAVGGTTLYFDDSGGYQSEAAWIGSSGGYSRFEAEPEYERSVQGTGRRSSPDVAFVGDPDTGVAVYQTSPATGKGSWYVVGGTSVGAPAWAGIIAIADQGRAIEGNGSLDGVTQTLPTLYDLASSDFNSVTPLRRFKLSATATANTATGLGSPVGQNLISGLVASDLAVSLSSSASVNRAVRRAPHARAHRKISEVVRARVNLIEIGLGRADDRDLAS